MAYDNIEVTRDGGVATIQLDRPKALNALNVAMMSELATALGALDDDAEIGCVILTGHDKAFAAGADIKEMMEDQYLDLYKNDRLGNLRSIWASCPAWAAHSVFCAPLANPKPWTCA